MSCRKLGWGGFQFKTNELSVKVPPNTCNKYTVQMWLWAARPPPLPAGLLWISSCHSPHDAGWVNSFGVFKCHGLILLSKSEQYMTNSTSHRPTCTLLLTSHSDLLPLFFVLFISFPHILSKRWCATPEIMVSCHESHSDLWLPY